MVPKSLVSILKVAVVAGVLAGAAAALFHSFFTEPVINRAIEMEERLNHSHHTNGDSGEEPVVSRRTQQIGLVIGFLLYGGAWGILFGILYYLIHPWFAPGGDAKGGFALALILGWSVSIFPFLKYPANPPGVGAPETFAYRQGLYLGFIGLSLLGTFLAIRLHSLLVSKKSAVFIAPALYAAYLIAVYSVMPPNSEPIMISSEVVWKFRSLSLAGLVLFWVVMAGIFVWKGGDLYGSNSKNFH